MEGISVVIQEYWLIACQRVLLAKESPYTVPVVGVAAVKLCGFKFGKLSDKLFIDDEPLVAVLSLCLVFVITDAFFKEVGHLEVWIA